MTEVNRGMCTFTQFLCEVMVNRSEQTSLDQLLTFQFGHIAERRRLERNLVGKETLDDQLVSFLVASIIQSEFLHLC